MIPPKCADFILISFLLQSSKAKGKPGRSGTKKRAVSPGRPGYQTESEEEAVADDGQEVTECAKGRKGAKEKDPSKKSLIWPPPVEDHNNDYCEVCHDGGDLICCDNCSCAYHGHCLV